jgi:aminocarboxymuconate-semialdehyde decarboxylase
VVFSDETGSTVVVDVHAHTVPASLARTARENGMWYGVPVRRRADGKVQWERGGRQITLTWEDPGGAYERRLADMDAQGVDVQILSHSPLMFWYDLEPGAAVAMAQEINDTIAGVADKWPARFQGLAYLPLQVPERAADELRRAVGDLGLAGAVVGTRDPSAEGVTRARQLAAGLAGQQVTVISGLARGIDEGSCNAINKSVPTTDRP